VSGARPPPLRPPGCALRPLRPHRQRLRRGLQVGAVLRGWRRRGGAQGACVVRARARPRAPSWAASTSAAHPPEPPDPACVPSGSATSRLLRCLRAGKLEAACSDSVKTLGRPTKWKAVPSPWRPQGRRGSRARGVMGWSGISSGPVSTGAEGGAAQRRAGQGACTMCSFPPAPARARLDASTTSGPSPRHSQPPHVATFPGTRFAH
jgi:hypothetical protein